MRSVTNDIFSLQDERRHYVIVFVPADYISGGPKPSGEMGMVPLERPAKASFPTGGKPVKPGFDPFARNP